jgi:DNA repair photolyase
MWAQRARWKSRSQDFSAVVPSPIKYIEKMFYKSNGMERALINMRSPAQIGHASDPCQPAERGHKITLKTFRILADLEYPAIITTKFPGLLTEEPYIGLIDRFPLVVQCSISSEDPAMLGLLEPNAPTWKRRLAALETLAGAGATCILRLWPYIPDLCGNIEVLLAAAYDAGVRIVQANFLKLFNAGRDKDRFRKALGYDYVAESCLNYEQRSNFKIPSPAVQLSEIRQLEEICADIGLEVLTCDDWTGTRAWRSCCGIDGVNGFKAAPWAYYVNGYRIQDHCSLEEYMKGLDCPWYEEFKSEWESGKLARALPDVIFHPDDLSYSRLSE